MNIKQVKIIKIVRIVLLALFLYFMRGSSQSYIISFLMALCAGALGETLPKKYRIGNTFLDSKYQVLEIFLEIIIAFILAWLFFIWL